MQKFRKWKCLASIFLCVALILPVLAFPVNAATIPVEDTDLTVSVTFTEEEGTHRSGSVSGSTITASAEGYDNGGWFGKKNTYQTITITNTTGNNLLLRGVIQITLGIGVGQTCTIKNNGTRLSSYIESGTYESDIKLANNTSLTIEFASPLGAGTSGVTYDPTIYLDVTHTVTFLNNDTYGSYTVDGAAMPETKDVTTVDGTVLQVTPKEGYVCVGFVNTQTGNIIDGVGFNSETSGKTTLIPSGSCTIAPVYIAKSAAKAIFTVGGDSFYTWESAMAESALTRANAILSTNYTLSTSLPTYYGTTVNTRYEKQEGSKVVYTVPQAAKLLIPHDAEGSYYTETRTESTCTVGSYTEPTRFLTLTVPTGVSVVVDGVMNVSGKHSTTQEANVRGGAPSGLQGFVDMAGGSITVNGKLYAWGYIIGTGTVTANSGAVVYQNLQIADFIGGTNVGAMDASYKVFPFSQYYVQNIEVPLRIYSGARLNAFTISNLGNKVYPALTFDMFGPQGFFNMTSGYLELSYDGTKDRTIYDVYGNMTVQGMRMAYDVLIASLDIDSKNYFFPINGNTTIHLHTGTITDNVQKLCFIPGSKLIVDEGAKLVLGGNCEVVFYDADQWGNYVGNSSTTNIRAMAYSPTRTYTRTASDLVDAEFLLNGEANASAGYVYATESGAKIYSTENGIMKNQAGTVTVTYQYNHDNGKLYDPITITPAKLLNEYTNNGALSAYTDTTTTGTYNYDAAHKRWVKDGHTWGQWSVTQEPTCTVKGIETRVCSCGVAETRAISTASHAAGTPVIEKEVKPTVNSGGSYETVVYCAGCGTELSREKTTLDPLPAVAQIGETKYPSLAEAYTAAAAGSTIKLLVPPADTDSVTFAKSLILDLTAVPDYAITAAEGWAIFASSENLHTVYKNSITANSATLVFESIVNVNIYFQPTGLPKFDLTNDAGLIVWTNEETAYSEDLLEQFVFGSSNVTASAGVEENGGFLVAHTGGIAAKELGDEFYWRVYVKLPNGTYVYSAPYLYGPQVYALKKMTANESTDELKRLMVAMLDYAAAAQLQFNYKTDDLANVISEADAEKYSVTTEDLQQYRTEFSETMLKALNTADESVVGDLARAENREECPGVFASLILEGIITNNFSFKFTPEIMDSVQTARFKFWNEADYLALQQANSTFAGSTPTMEIDLVLDEADGFYKGGYNKTAVKNLGDSFYVCAEVTTENGETYNSGIVSYSGHTFIRNNLSTTNANFANLVRCLAVYSDAAEKFFS